MKREDFLILWDNGHGNDTAGKRSPVWTDQEQLFEWEWTRRLAQFCTIKSNELSIKSKILTPELDDISLSERCRRENEEYKKNKNTIFVSLHGNAFGVESVNGFEVFTSIGVTDSDLVAKEILLRAKETGVFNMRMNEGHEYLNKEARFKVLTGTKGKAVLVEAGFYTNKKEAAYMQSIEGLNVISSIIVEGISNYINNEILIFKNGRKV